MSKARASGGGGKLSHRPVVCPHCWHDFFDDEAYYISQHDELRGDPVISDPDAYRRFAPHEAKIDRNGIVKDTNGLEMRERACPRCHLQIPTELLEHRPIFVSIAGAAYSGKTYFLTSMLHTLALQMAKSFQYNFSYSDSHDVRAYKELDKELFRGPADGDAVLEKTQEQANTNRVTLDGMKVFLPKPFMFRLTPTHDHPDVAAGKPVPEANFVFYDNAGEAFDPDKGQHRQSTYRTTQHLKESSGVLFVYDLLQDSHVRDRLAGSADPQVSRQPKDCAQEAIVENLIHQMRNYRGLSPRDRIDVPIAVCVQKFDAWRSLLPDWVVLDDCSIEYIRQIGTCALHLDEISRNSLFVRQLLEDVAPRFVSLVESSFSVVRYFPVSALGASPREHSVSAGENDKKALVIRRRDITPIRVTDPLLWFFSRWKLIRFALSKKQAELKASVVAANADRLTVLFPGSNKRMTLDWEYSGITTIDPTSGTPVHIPQVPRPSKVVEGAEGVTSTGPRPVVAPPKPPAARKQGLSLENPEAPKKKGGWWNG
jgi:hypothetical protein